MHYIEPLSFLFQPIADLHKDFDPFRLLLQLYEYIKEACPKFP